MLLLICAGALIVIIATIASAIDEAHSIHVAQNTERFCGMTVAQYQALPTALQYRVNAQCVAEPASDR